MGFVSSISADSVLKAALRRVGRSQGELERDGIDERMIAELERGLSFFLGSPGERRDCITRLTELVGAERPSLPVDVEIPVNEESAVVDARTRARTFARDIGFDRADQAKIATTVSELARNIVRYAGAGRVSLGATNTPRVGMRIVAADEGPGIRNLPEILAGSYRSKTGMGLGIIGCKRLMDEFSIDTAPGRGTVVTLRKFVA